ncbi:hypothetical protein HZC21_01455 [Candidatus Peregrinibacteria bacterium]|nr:hypothetical protein [Candidatus Peregrinibacteria bacterium]
MQQNAVFATQTWLEHATAADEPTEYDAKKLTKDYHKTVNDIFNDKIQALVTLANSKKKEDFEKILELVSPPEFKKDEEGQMVKRKECDSKNLSTYCLAMVVTNKYFEFRANMLKAREMEKQKAATQFATQTGKKPQAGETSDTLIQQRTLFGAIGDIFQGEKAIQSYGVAINDIDREIDLARQALDQTLASYNEMQMALIMHSKYKKIIESLETYRDKISEIRKEVDLYPITFLDLTTTACN